MDREAHFASHLKLVDSVFAALWGDLDAEELDKRLVVVGPSIEEIRAHAPTISSALNLSYSNDALLKTVDRLRCASSIVPIPAGTRDHTEQVEAVWRRFAPRVGHTRAYPLLVFAAPPEADLRRTLPRTRGKPGLPGKGPLTGAIAGVLLASTLLECQALVIGSTEALVERSNRPLLDAILNEYLRYPDFDALIESYALSRKDQQESAEDEVASYVRDQWSTLASGRVPGCLPLSSWTIELEVTTSLLWITSDLRGAPGAAHLRHFPTGLADQLIQDQGFVNGAVDVARECGARGDDDRFVPTFGLLRTGKWALLREERDVQPFGPLIDEARFPMRRLATVCDLIEIVEVEAATPSEDAVWLWCQANESTGRHDIRVAIEPPKQKIGSLFRLSCDNPRLLARVLAGHDVSLLLRCAATGSFSHPRFSVPMLREFEIPWPDAHVQKAIADEIERLFKLPKLIEDELGTIERKVHSLKERLDDDDVHPIPPFWTDGALANVRDEVKKLAGLVGIAANVEPARSPPRKPAPIAILERQLNHEGDVRVQLDIAHHLAEMVIRFDTLILLSILELNGSGFARSALEVAMRGKWNTQILKPTMGDWSSIQRECRRLCRQLHERGNLAAAALAPDWVEAVTLCSEVELDRLVEPLIRSRNMSRHGVAVPSEDEAAFELRQHRERVEQLERKLHYSTSCKLIYVEQIRRERFGCRVRYRLLIGDNEAFAPVEKEVPTTSAWAGCSGREAYLLLKEPDLILSLWPWILFERTDRSRESVWVFTSLDRKGASFASPGRSEVHIEARASEAIRCIFAGREGWNGADTLTSSGNP